MIARSAVSTFGPVLTPEDWRTIRELESANWLYHSMIFPGGKSWQGRLDLARVLPHYHLPEDFAGRTVLDVGPADGFFSFLAEERKASQITAIQPGPPYAGFSFAHRHLQSRVAFSQTSIYDLNSIQDSRDQFDYVLCFSVLLHLPDLYSAITGLFAATRRVAYVATRLDTAADAGELASTPYVLFNGQTLKGGIGGATYREYWYPNSCAMVHMAKLAGFTDAQVVDHFYLSDAIPNTKGGKSNYHGVFRFER